MRLKLKHITLSLSLLTLAVACKEEEAISINTPSEGKTPIELSVGVNSPSSITRAQFTNGTTNTDFGGNTKVFILMQSDKEVDVHGGLEYTGTRANTLYTVSRGDIEYNTDKTKLIFDDKNQKYWDDAHARSTQLTLWAVAQRVVEPEADGKWKTITFQKLTGENSNYPSISETSAAGFNTTNRNDWQSERIYPAIYSWSVGNPAQNQTDKTLIYQDLLFSNNISYNAEKNWADNRLKFDFNDTHKFPASTELKFYHAMSKITIKLIAGDGFKKDGSDFSLAKSTIDKLDGFNTRGLFNIKDGEFQMIHQSEPITTIPCTENTNNNPYYTLEALVIPNIHEFMLSQRTTEKPDLKDENSRFVIDGANTMMEFTIDNNTYKISSKQLFDALMQHDASGNQTDPVPNATKKTGTGDDSSMGTYIPLEAGKNYVFTFKVSKSKINGITAQVVNWETVEANDIPASNARIRLQLEDRGTPVASGVDFYRTKDAGNSDITDTYKGYKWETGYEKGTGNFSENTWQPTNWYWNDNTEYYHFRAVGEKKDSDPVAPAVTSNAFTLTAGETYSDYIWGAPFKELDSPTPSDNTTKIVYSNTYGFDGTYNGSDDNTHQIYHGIGPTPDPIKLLMFHMMSEVTIKVQSVTGDAAVQLTNGDDKTTIKFENIHTTGSVALGNGLVSTRGEATTSNITMSTTANQWLYGAIPQNLDGPTTAATDDVILVITTPDHNEYRVSMKDVKVSTVNTANIANPYRQVGGTGADMDKYIINRWYPGFKYEYTFVLSKKKIEDITATVVNWETVTAEDEVQIQ